MSLTIGRLGLSVTAPAPQAVKWSASGEVVVSGFLEGSTVAEVEELVQQALGLPSGDDLWKPVTASHNSRLDGLYRVHDVEVEAVLGASPPDGNLYRASFQLERFPNGFAVPWCQSILTGKVRANAHSIVSSNTSPWHAVPSTVEGYFIPDGSALPVAGTRQGDGGTATIYRPALQKFYDAQPSYFVPLDDWYSMAPSVKVDGAPVIGAQTLHSPTNWSIENQLLRIQSGAASSASLSISCHDGTSWSTPVLVNIGYWAGGTPFGSGTWTAVTDIVTARVVRTGVASAEIVLSFIHPNISLVQLSISLRRGARLADCYLESANDLQIGVRPATTFAATTSTAGVVHQTSNNTDGDRLVFMSTADFSGDTSTGTLVASSDVHAIDLGIGFEVDGTSAPSGDTVATLRPQYFAGQNETIEVVAL